MKLNEILTPDTMFDGRDFLFVAIFQEIEYPSDIDPIVLNLEYVFNHSGDKQISPLCEKIYSLSNANIDAFRENMTVLVSSKYKLKWSKLLKTLMFEYNPIANVESKETFTYSKMGEEITTTDYGKSDTLTKTGTIIEDITGSDVSETVADKTNIIEKEVSAYNSDMYEPREKETNTSNITQDKTTLTKSDKNTDTFDTQDVNAQSGEDVNTLSFIDRKDIEERVREGNIGTTMTQEMIEAERQLWLNDIIDVFYDDLDKLFCLDTY